MRSILWGSALALVLASCTSSDDGPRNEGDAGMDAGDAATGNDAAADTGQTRRDGGNDADASDAAGDAGSSDASGGDAGGDAGGGDAGDDPRTILERTSLGTYACSVRRELLSYKPLSWGYSGSDVLSAGADAAWVARVEAEEGSSPFELGPAKFVLSKVDADGALGPRTEVTVADPSQISRPVIVAAEAGAFVLLWSETQMAGGANTQQVLRFASFDAAGSLTAGPEDLASERSDSPLGALAAARASSGELGVVWSSVDQQGRNVTKLAVFSASGDMRGTARTLAERALPSAEIVWTGDAFAALWLSFDAATTTGDVHFARFTAAGEPAGSAVRLSTPGSIASVFGFAGSALSLVQSGEELIAAWSEGARGNDDFANPSGAYSVIRVARLNASGSLLSSAVLRAKTDSIDEEEPLLVPFGADVALLWGRGTHIYVCAGCVPDHTLELVVLDPKTLTPRSNVAKIMASRGGLLRKHVATAGALLLTTMEVTFHVSSEPAFAAFQCQASGS